MYANERRYHVFVDSTVVPSFPIAPTGLQFTFPLLLSKKANITDVLAEFTTCKNVPVDAGMVSNRTHTEHLVPASAATLVMSKRAFAAGLPVLHLDDLDPVFETVESLATVPDVDVKNEKSPVASVPDSMNVMFGIRYTLHQFSGIDAPSSQVPTVTRNGLRLKKIGRAHV